MKTFETQKVNPVDKLKIGKNDSADIAPGIDNSGSEADLWDKLAGSKSRQAELMTNGLNSKFNQELTRLEAVTLTGNIIEDTRQVAKAQGSIAPDMTEALEREDKDQLKEIVMEWINGIDAYLAGNGATDEKVAPLINNQEQIAMLTKKSELLSNILRSSK